MREEERGRFEQKRMEEVLKKEQAINDALRALCRDRILQGYKYYKKSGGLTAQDLETMSKLYNAYHALGGNGTESIRNKELEIRNEKIPHYAFLIPN